MINHRRESVIVDKSPEVGAYVKHSRSRSALFNNEKKRNSGKSSN